MKKSTPTLTAGLLAAFLAAGALAGCNSGDSVTDSPTQGAAVVSNPCELFNEEIAQGLGNGPYLAGSQTVTAKVSICQRVGDVKAPNMFGATARFERMTKEEFLGMACSVPLNPETNQPLYDVDTLAGIHVAACRFKPYGEANVGISVLTESGWAVMVGSAPEAKCLAAIEKLVPKLPR
jgi:hypothetical protein